MPVSSNVRRLTPMPTFHTRPSTKADAEFIYQLTEKTIRPHVESIGKKWATERMRAKCIDDAILSTSRIILVCANDAGFLNYEVRSDEIWIDSLLLLPTYQRRGFGTQILTRITNEAKQCALPIRLGVFISNPAKSYWEQRGFVVFKEDNLHYYMQRAA